MKFKMAPNSIFAVLLRNPWWISFALAAVISLLCAALLPKHLAIYGVLGTFPFVVIGCVALSRQWNKPSQAAVQKETARLAALSWRDFSKELVAQFTKQGFEIELLRGKRVDGAADFLLSKAGQTTLVAAKRYKAASHGIEPLQALVAQQVALRTDKTMYVCLGALSEQAQTFAREKNVTVGWVA